nr:Chain A, Soluble quino protein glucose dehydrogenase [Trichoderma reesei RUT C-30]
TTNNLQVTYPAPVAADGWEYRLISTGLTAPRSIVFDSTGGLLVLDAGVGVRRLTLQDNGGTCLSVTANATLIADTALNHGLAISADGGTIYASTVNDVYAYTYNEQTNTVDPTTRRTVVTNMTNTDHVTRTLLLSSRLPNELLVSRGSAANEDPQARNVTSGHSQIRAYDISTLAATDPPFDFVAGTLIGWGLRDSVGVGENPTNGGIWSVENSVDDLTREGVDVHQDNPGEELNFHGILGNTANQGGNYGYPDCYALWSTAGFPDLGALEVGDQFASDNATAGVTDATCNTNFVDPRLVFQAHVSPLDIKFNTNGTTAYITFHGSTDRTTPVGYSIVSVAFGLNGQPTSPMDSTTAANNILTSPDLTQCPDDCFTPVGLTFDTIGRLFFSSDSTGEIFVLQQS